MASLAGHPSHGVSEGRRWLRFLVPEMWASLAIAVMWLAVLLDALFGPDIVSSNVTSTTRVPSVIVVAFFAFLATRVVARYAFAHSRKDVD